MSDYEEEEATPEEKLRIATHFLLKSPAGEIDDLVVDLKKLMVNDANSILSDDNLDKILREYNTTQLYFAKNDEDGEMMIISDVGEKDKTTYYNPKTKRYYKFDHQKKKILDVTKGSLKISSSIESYRKAIEASIEEYTKETYTSGKYACATYANSDGLITIILSARNVNLRNFWTGSQRSVYTVNVSKKTQRQLDGMIKFNVHYFEDGNVQLNTNYKRSESFDIEKPEQTAESVRQMIQDIETDYINRLEQFYVDMHQTTFKAMRRILPVTGTKMQWKIHGHSLAEEVSRYR